MNRWTVTRNDGKGVVAPIEAPSAREAVWRWWVVERGFEAAGTVLYVTVHLLDVPHAKTGLAYRVSDEGPQAVSGECK